MKTVPYFYVIREKETGIQYAGMRYKKGCHPDELLKEGGYTTSSKIINSIIAEKGLDAFEIVSVKTESELGIGVDEYENRFLLENNCVHSDQWYNLARGGVKHSTWREKKTSLGIPLYKLSKEETSKKFKKAQEKNSRDVDIYEKEVGLVHSGKLTSFVREGVEIPNLHYSLKNRRPAYSKYFVVPMGGKPPEEHEWLIPKKESFDLYVYHLGEFKEKTNIADYARSIGVDVTCIHAAINKYGGYYKKGEWFFSLTEENKPLQFYNNEKIPYNVLYDNLVTKVTKQFVLEKDGVIEIMSLSMFARVYGYSRQTFTERAMLEQKGIIRGWNIRVAEESEYRGIAFYAGESKC